LAELLYKFRQRLTLHPNSTTLLPFMQIKLSQLFWRKLLLCITSLTLIGHMNLAASQSQVVEHPKVKISTNMGDIVIELYPEYAPKTVANFLQYVGEHHYDGTIFHRVINNFMIQGGGYTKSMFEKKTHPPIKHEGQAAIALGGPHNTVGTVAMARTGDPDSAAAQFFINVQDNPFLDPIPVPAGDPVPSFTYNGRTYTNIPRENLTSSPKLFGYTVFGKVISGMEVVNAIKAVPTGSAPPFPSDVPKSFVFIQSASTIK